MHSLSSDSSILRVLGAPCEHHLGADLQVAFQHALWDPFLYDFECFWLPLGAPWGAIWDTWGRRFFDEITETLRVRVGGLAGSPGEGFREG